MIAAGLKGKKRSIVESALDLFVSQGFHGSTTARIAFSAEVTEPLIYYHFGDKKGVFEWIIEAAFREYFTRFEQIGKNAGTAFEKIADLFAVHLRFVREMPRESYLIITACPSKLLDRQHICYRNIQRQRESLVRFLRDSVQSGIESGEFRHVPLDETVYLIISFLNGLMRQYSIVPFTPGEGRNDTDESIVEEAAGFLRRSLVGASGKASGSAPCRQTAFEYCV